MSEKPLMVNPKKMLVAICFDEEMRPETVRKVLSGIGRGVSRNPWCRWHEPNRLVVLPDAETTEDDLQRAREMPGVRRVVGLPADSPLTSYGPDRQRSVVRLPNGVRIGADELTIIAGPCSVESESQICEIAAIVKEAGAQALRGGVFKPRSSPYTFGGLGVDGLECLCRAREATGLPVVTEALDTADVDLVACHADVIQIGSRNMYNFPLLFKAGSHPSGKPVLLKRGFAASIDELLLAAEYVLLGRLLAGIDDPALILCERGIRTFETSTRFTLDVGAIPVLRDRTHLPIIADPSHAAGRRTYVPPLARAAAAAGADGLIVEVHTDPAAAWSDADQCLDPEAFRQLMRELRVCSSDRRNVAVKSRDAAKGVGPGTS